MIQDLPKLKAQLASAVRLLYLENLIDFNGHVSVRVQDRVYINARPISRAAVQAKHIVAVNLNGEQVEGDFEPPGETALHTAIYRSRADVMSVAHLHPHHVTVLGIAQEKIVPVFILGSIFADGVPVYDDPDLIFTDAQGDAVAETLGAARAAVLRGHGAVVVGVSLEETFATSVYLEENAKKQYAASALGKPRAFTPDEARRVRTSLWKPKTVQKVWDFYVSKGRALGVLADE